MVSLCRLATRSSILSFSIFMGPFWNFLSFLRCLRADDADDAPIDPPLRDVAGLLPVVVHPAIPDDGRDDANDLAERAVLGFDMVLGWAAESGRAAVWAGGGRGELL